MSEENRLVYSVEVTADKIYIIHLKDVFDASTVEEFEHVLEYLIARGQYRLIIDLSRVEFISSAGWGIFTAELKNCHDHDGDIMIVGMQPDVEDVYMLLELDTIMSSYESVEAGLAAMREKFGLPGVAEQAKAPAAEEQQPEAQQRDGAVEAAAAPAENEEAAPEAAEQKPAENQPAKESEIVGQESPKVVVKPQTGDQEQAKTDTATFQAPQDTPQSETEQALNGTAPHAEDEADDAPVEAEPDRAPVVSPENEAPAGTGKSLNGHTEEPVIKPDAEQGERDAGVDRESFDETGDPWPSDEFIAPEPEEAESSVAEEQKSEKRPRRRLSYRARRKNRWLGAELPDASETPSAPVESESTQVESPAAASASEAPSEDALEAPLLDSPMQEAPVDAAFYELDEGLSDDDLLVSDFSHDPLLEQIISVVIANPSYGPSLIRKMLITMNLADNSLTRSMVYRKLSEVNLSTRARRIAFAKANRI